MSSSRLAPPIIVEEGVDLEFFESLEDVGRCLEPWATTYLDFVAFDSEGRGLELDIELHVEHRKWLPDLKVELVRVRAGESEPSHAEELRALVSEYCAAVGVSVDSHAPLEKLLRAAIERAGFTS